MAEFEGYAELKFSCNTDEDAQALRGLAQEWIDFHTGSHSFSEDKIDSLSWLVDGWESDNLSIYSELVYERQGGDSTRKRMTAFLNEVVDQLPNVEFKGALDVFDVMRGIQRAKVQFDSAAAKSSNGYIQVISDDGEAPKTIGDGTDYINKSGTITIPEGVVAIADRAFESEHLPELAKPPRKWEKQPKGSYWQDTITVEGIKLLPSTLRVIGNSAFSSWYPKRHGYRAEVVIPKGVSRVGIGAFAGFNKVTVYDCYDKDKKPPTRENWLEGRSGSAWKGCLNRDFDRTLLGWVSSTDDKRYLDQGVADLDNHHDSRFGTALLWCLSCQPIEIEVRSAETDEVKFRTWMPINDPGEEVPWMLASAWGGGASAYFPAFDEVFDNLRWATPGKVGIALFRLRWPFDLTDELKEKYENFVKAGAKAKMAARLLIADDDAEGLRLFEHLRLVKKGNIDELIEYAVKGKNTEHAVAIDEHHPEWIKRKGKNDACPECAQYLVEFKEEHFKAKTRK